ncbi:MAG: hypothetical protein AAF634_03480 [Bacteroidota bacterium]
MKHFYPIFAFVVVFTTTIGYGQSFRYTQYKDNRTPFKGVNQILEDHKGFVWIASDNGLYRFDGQNFLDFNTSLKSKHIHQLVQDSDTLYFSNDAGIYKLYYEQNEVTLTPYQAIGEGTELGFINVLFLDSERHLWASSSEGKIFKINRNDKNIKTYQLPIKTKVRYTFLGEDGNNTLWALSPGNGLFHFDITSDSFVQLPGFNDMHHFYIDEDMLFVAGSGIQGFAIIAPNTLKKRIEIQTGDTIVKRIAKDKNSRFFVSTGSSVFSFTDEAPRLKKVFGSNDPHRLEALPFAEINTIGFSQDQLRKGGKIWISTKDGLWLLKTDFFSSVEGMPHDNVLGITTSEKQQNVLVSQGRVFEIDITKKNKIFSSIAERGRVTGISMYGNTRYYGSTDAKISVFKDQEELRTLDLQSRGGGVFFTFSDATGNLWFCQAPSDKPLQGVGKLKPDGQLKFYGAEHGLDSRILVIREGGRSEIYAAGIGIQSYLFKYNSVTDRFEPKSLALPEDVSTNFEVHDLAIDPLGIVWLGTTDGLLKYDTETIKRIDLGPFSNNEIRAVRAVQNGGVWIATDTDGLLYRYPSGAYVQFDETSGTPSKIASYRSLSLDANGTIWVGTAEGAVYSSMQQPEPLRTNPPGITAVYVNDRLATSTSFLFSNQDDIRLKFATIAYPAKGLQYQYKMVGSALSKEAADHTPWSSAFSLPEVYLQNLPPGEHTVLIRAQQPGGYNWSAPVSMPLRVKKVWYATWWGLGLILAATLLLFWYVTYLWGYRKTKTLSAELSKKEQDLEDKHAQLSAKSSALSLRERELKSTGANLYMLNRLLDQLPNSASWAMVFPVLKKLVQQPTPIAAFEIGFKKANEIHYQGYTRNEGLLFERKAEFNEKENLQSYAICGNIPLLIRNFETEVTQYIGTKTTVGYASLIVIPFKQTKGPDAVFCAYAEEKDGFSQRDLTLLQVLVKFLSATVKDTSK